MAILTSAGITFGDATTQTTAAVAGVTSLNGQTGAITNTTFNAIGSYVIAMNNFLVQGSTSVEEIGSTVAGSVLKAGNSEPASPFINDNVFTNIGASGTYRRMARTRGYNYGDTTSCGPALWVRIS